MSEEPREPPIPPETTAAAGPGDEPEDTSIPASPSEAPSSPSSAESASPTSSPEPSPQPSVPEEPPRWPSSPEAPKQRHPRPSPLAEQPEIPIEVPDHKLAAQSRRDFLLLAAGAAVALTGAWWLLPDATKARLLPESARRRLDTLAGRVGLSGDRREELLDGALTFDDDVAEALYSKDRRVRTYDRSQVTFLKNNYHGQTPGPEYLPTWSLSLTGLASGTTERLSIEELGKRFPFHEQVTRLVCVEGWSAIAWWGGIRFADLLAAFPPAPGARWAAMRSSVSLDFHGRPEPYYVSLDLGTAHHPQTLLATHLGGRRLNRSHGAPLRLVAPMKLGLKNIKAITDVAYTATEPPDYWAERGYSRYDGL